MATQVSVVVPTFHRAELLEATLASLENLGLDPLEVIVCTDDWADGSDLVARRHGARAVDTDLTGATGHRNAGWRAARGDVVAFIDDDCVARPGWLHALVAPFSDPSVGLVQGRTVPQRPTRRRERSLDIPCEYGLYETCNIAYRRAVLEQTGGFDPAFEKLFGGRPFGEDADLAYRARRAGWATAFAEEAVVAHHVFPASLRQALEEEWRRGYFPRLVKLVPEVTGIFPGPRWSMREQSLRAQMLLVGLLVGLVGRRPLVGAALALPYLRWARARFRGRDLYEQALGDLVASLSLVIGSVRARRLLV
jgi:cellulose synthase/poly-beta-1,6-N-acetylglucosamine synthase-like glycosyltransferase